MAKLQLLLVSLLLANEEIYGKVIFENGLKNADYKGTDFLDNNNKYEIAWEINSKEGIIQIAVIAETLGYVGFGFSPNGGMTGADIFIAGVKEGMPYYSDCHGVGNTKPIADSSQDWNLIRGEESDTHTKLVFSRKLNTCDNEDFEITDQTMHVIWSMGATDDIEYHEEVRGTKSVNLFLANDQETFDPSEFEKLDIVSTREMAAEHTEYWCTIHEIPKFTKNQHIVAFEPILAHPDALQHTHHFNFYRCHPPEGQDPEEFFKPWLSHPGDYCYDQKNVTFPFEQYCNGNMIYVWAKGGKLMVFPDTMGLPFPDVLNKHEYWAMEVHYDNPQKLAGKNFPTGGRMYITDKVRDIDAGIFVVDHKTSVQLTVPPKSDDYVVTGHCSPECTKQILPEDGINIFNNMLHAHLAGRKIKFRHFRNDQELEWIDRDDYYDFNYQQNKPMGEVRKVLPGDQLTVECTYQSGDKVVIGGLSSTDEMCQSFFFYWPKQEMDGCGSAQEQSDHMKLLGFEEVEDVGSNFPGGFPTYRVIKPDNLAGDYADVVSNKLNWTAEFRERFQQEKRFGVHQGVCSREGKAPMPPGTEGPVSYPKDLKEYVPVNVCDREGGSSTTPENNGVDKLSASLSLILVASVVFWY